MASPSDVDSRLNSYWERWGAWVAVLLLSVCAYTFQEQKSRIDKLEENVQQLYMEKASKEDMREFENRVARQVDGIKNDILGRLDFYFNTPKQKATNK